MCTRVNRTEWLRRAQLSFLNIWLWWVRIFFSTLDPEYGTKCYAFPLHHKASCSCHPIVSLLPSLGAGKVKTGRLTAARVREREGGATPIKSTSFLPPNLHSCKYLNFNQTENGNEICAAQTSQHGSCFLWRRKWICCFLYLTFPKLQGAQSPHGGLFLGVNMRGTGNCGQRTCTRVRLPPQSCWSWLLLIVDAHRTRPT